MTRRITDEDAQAIAKYVAQEMQRWPVPSQPEAAPTSAAPTSIDDDSDLSSTYPEIEADVRRTVDTLIPRLRRERGKKPSSAKSPRRVARSGTR